MANEQLNMNIAASKLQPIYADGTALVMRIKSYRNEKGDIEKDGQVEIIFLDMLTQQPVGEYVISKNTARELIDGLAKNLASIEKELASSELPKPPEVKTSGDPSYR